MDQETSETYEQAILAPQTGTRNLMKFSITAALAVFAISLTSCATPKPPQVFHNIDKNAVVIDSLDDKTGQILKPTASARADNEIVLSKAMELPKRQTAVVILENYDEPQIGLEYRIRGTPWFIGLRGLGYEHIVFLRGRGVANPEGLITLSEYF